MSQKVDTMIKLGLVFFVTLLSFAIGTYVGKKYSDNQHKLSLLEPKKHSSEIAHKSDEFASEGTATENGHNPMPTTTEQRPPAALTDAEVAKIAEEFATDDGTDNDKMIATIDNQEKDIKTISDSQSEKTVGTKHPTPTLAQKVKSVEKTPETRIPASIPPKTDTMSSLLFTVQIGSYATQAEAEKLTQDLQSKGFKTSFVPAKVNGQMWYRVNVGLFGTIKEAQDYKKEFLIKTKLASAIVQRVQQ